MSGLFEKDDARREPRADGPVADRMRPRSLDELVGQEHLLGPDALLSRMLAVAMPSPSAPSSGAPKRPNISA